MTLRPALLLIAALTALPAHAQYVNTLNGMQFNNIYAANADFMMSQMIQNARFQSLALISQQSAKNAAAAKPVQKPAAAPTPAAFQFPLEASDFKPAGPRNVAQQLAAGVKNPAEKKQLVELCQQLQQAIEAQPDVRKNNLATAMTILLGSALQVRANRELTDAESDELLRTVNDALVGAPGFKTMDSKKRTLAYDAFLITGGLIAGAAEAGKEDPATAAVAKQLADSVLAQFGVK